MSENPCFRHESVGERRGIQGFNPRPQCEFLPTYALSAMNERSENHSITDSQYVVRSELVV